MKSNAIFGFPGEETGDTTWMTPEEFEENGRDLHKDMVRVTVMKIKQLEGLA